MTFGTRIVVFVDKFCLLSKLYIYIYIYVYIYSIYIYIYIVLTARGLVVVLINSTINNDILLCLIR